MILLRQCLEYGECTGCPQEKECQTTFAAFVLNYVCADKERKEK